MHGPRWSTRRVRWLLVSLSRNFVSSQGRIVETVRRVWRFYFKWKITPFAFHSTTSVIFYDDTQFSYRFHRVENTIHRQKYPCNRAEPSRTSQKAWSSCSRLGLRTYFWRCKDCTPGFWVIVPSLKLLSSFVLGSGSRYTDNTKSGMCIR